MRPLKNFSRNNFGNAKNSTLVQFNSWYEPTEYASFYGKGILPSCVFTEIEYVVNTEHIKPVVQSYFKTDSERVSLSV